MRSTYDIEDCCKYENSKSVSKTKRYQLKKLKERIEAFPNILRRFRKQNQALEHLNYQSHVLQFRFVCHERKVKLATVQMPLMLQVKTAQHIDSTRHVAWHILQNIIRRLNASNSFGILCSLKITSHFLQMLLESVYSLSRRPRNSYELPKNYNWKAREIAVLVILETCNFYNHFQYGFRKLLVPNIVRISSCSQVLRPYLPQCMYMIQNAWYMKIYLCS